MLAAIDLAPADTATLDPEKVIALITSDGGPQAHTAILARGLGLPAIVAAKGVTEIPDGTVVYVDSNEGIVDTEPTDADRQAAEKYANRKPIADFCTRSRRWQAEQESARAPRARRASR